MGAEVVRVKVCGVTNVADARACVEAGVDAIGLNFVPTSPRFVEVEVARTIAAAVEGRALVVGVVADLPRERVARLRDEVPLGCVQFHGDETPAIVAAFLPHAYKAVRVATKDDVARAADFPGEYVLVDAKVEGVLGGSGVRIDPALVAALARSRKLTLAGGLTPENVTEAIAAVHPYAVDVASGVEAKGDPRRKDAGRVRAFVEAARRPPF